MWNNTRNLLKLSTTDADGPYIEFQINNNVKGYVGYYEATGVAVTWLGAGSNRLFLDTAAASLRVGTDEANYTVYHSGNSNKSDVPWTCGASNAWGITAWGGSEARIRGGYTGGYGMIIDSTASSASVYLLRVRSVVAHDGNTRTEVLCANSDGNVGIGTSSPTEKLYVSGNILASGTITPGSDSRIKDNQKEISSKKAFSVIEGLKPKTWIWNEKSNENLNGRSAAGLVAQEVKEILPDAVTISENGDIKDFHSLNYNTIQGYEIAAIKGLIEEVKSLKAEIVELKKQIK